MQASLIQDHDLAKSELERLKSKYADDLRRLKALKLLFSKCIENIHQQHTEEVPFEEEEINKAKGFEHQSIVRDRKMTLSALSINDRETILTKMVAYIDTQLEVDDT